MGLTRLRARSGRPRFDAAPPCSTWRLSNVGAAGDGRHLVVDLQVLSMASRAMRRSNLWGRRSSWVQMLLSALIICTVYEHENVYRFHFDIDTCITLIVRGAYYFPVCLRSGGNHGTHMCQLFHMLGEAVAPGLEELTASSEFRDVTAHHGQPAARKRSEAASRQWLHALNLPAATDIRRRVARSSDRQRWPAWPGGARRLPVPVRRPDDAAVGCRWQPAG